MNAALRNLKAAGLVQHGRGRVAIADRAGLETAACPCHRAERAALERLLPGGFGAALREERTRPGPVRAGAVPELPAF